MTKVGVHDKGYNPTMTIQPNSMDMATTIIRPNKDNATHGDGTATPISSSTTAQYTHRRARAHLQYTKPDPLPIQAHHQRVDPHKGRAYPLPTYQVGMENARRRWRWWRTRGGDGEDRDGVESTRRGWRGWRTRQRAGENQEEVEKTRRRWRGRRQCGERDEEVESNPALRNHSRAEWRTKVEVDTSNGRTPPMSVLSICSTHNYIQPKEG